MSGSAAVIRCLVRLSLSLVILGASATARGEDSMVFELRTYTTLDGRLPALVENGIQRQFLRAAGHSPLR